MASETKTAGNADGKMTIGELAQRTGMTIRNIRAHQTRGLLPPPEVHGRTGYYGEALATIEKLSRASRSSARAFVSLFLDELWKPFDEAGRPDDDWPKMIAAIERLRPIAVDAMVATFRLSLTEEVDKAFGEVLERAQKKK